MREFTKEADVKAVVKVLLSRHGWMWWMPPANGYGKSNVDFNALHPEHGFLAVETKFGGSTPTILQRQFLTKTSRYGGTAVVVDEKTLKCFQSWVANPKAPVPDALLSEPA